LYVSFRDKPFSIEGFVTKFHKMMHDHEMLCSVEVKKNEIIFNMHREFMEKIEGLERETGKVRGRLTSKYGSF
jgi:hypothetical protein